MHTHVEASGARFCGIHIIFFFEGTSVHVTSSCTSLLSDVAVLPRNVMRTGDRKEAGGIGGYKDARPCEGANVGVNVKAGHNRSRLFLIRHVQGKLKVCSKQPNIPN